MVPDADNRLAVYGAVFGSGAVALSVSLLWPPAFWLCGIGGALLGIAVCIASIGRRKDFGIFWLPKSTPPLPSWEVALSLTALMLVVIPLVVVVVRNVASP